MATTTDGVLDSYTKRQNAIAAAKEVLVIGGSLAGIEYAGYIKSAYPSTKVTLVHGGPALMSVVPTITAKAQSDVHNKLVAMGVEVVLNEALELPPVTDDLDTPVRRTLKGTQSGREFTSDYQIFAIGRIKLNSDVVATAWADLVGPDGIAVNEPLQVQKHPRVVARGDVAATGALKTAANARPQAAVVVANIKKLITSGGQTDGLSAYKAGHVMLLVSLGPSHGTGQGSPFDQWTLTGWLANKFSALKGRDLFIGRVTSPFQAVLQSASQ